MTLRKSLRWIGYQQSKSGFDGRLSIGRFSGPSIPFITHQTRPPKESIHSFGVATSPKGEQATERRIGSTVVVSILRGVASPQAAEAIPIARALRPFDKFFVRQITDARKALSWYLRRRREKLGRQGVKFLLPILNGNGSSRDMLTRHREVPAGTVHFDKSGSAPIGGHFGFQKNVDTAAGRRKLRVANSFFE